MTPDDCEPSRNEGGERWFSALRLKQKGVEEAPCTCRNTLVGACVTVGGKHMNYECAPRTSNVEEDYCHKTEGGKDPTYEILPTNEAGTNCYCDILQSIEDDSIRGSPSARTKYGACYDHNAGEDEKENRFFCAYSSDYCTGNHMWVHPNDVPTIRGDGEYCTCESTHTGGCVGGMHPFHCALSEQDCNWNTFVPPIRLKTDHNHACFLCEETFTVNPKQDEIDALAYMGYSKLTSAEAISIGVASSAIALVVLVGLGRSFVRRKNRTQQKQATEKSGYSDGAIAIDGQGALNTGEDDSLPGSIPVDKDSFVIS